MVKNIGVFKDFNDGTLKSVFEVDNDSNKIIEMSLLFNRENTDVLCCPTHHYCNLKCKMCHLTKEGINKGMGSIDSNSFIDALIKSLTSNNKRRTNNEKLLISFMGVGEPLLNLELLKEVYEKEEYIKEKLGYKSVGYAMASMIPNEMYLYVLKQMVLEIKMPIKLHFSLHSPLNEIRKNLIPSSKSSVNQIFSQLEKYRDDFLKDEVIMNKFMSVHRNPEPVEVHYTLIKDVNDSVNELASLKEYLIIYNVPIKFIKFNPKEDMSISMLEEEWVRELNNINVKVKRYTPPGKEVGSSCGEFTKHYYLSSLESEEEKEEFKKWKILHQIYEAQRNDYIDWDEFFMGVAKLSGMRSKDPNTQVGACIASFDNRILSVGYNGAPNNFNDELFPWNREGDELETKYMYVVHAERNAILNYRGSAKDLEGSKIYVDLFPCNECAKEIVQAGIKEVVYLSDKYANLPNTIASKRIFDACGVKYRQLSKEYQKDITLSLKLK